MEYYAKFNFSKDDIPEDIKNLMINDFVAIRELAVDITNPMLTKWNKEFDSQVGTMGDDNCIYNKWISEKLNSICDIVNEKCTASCVKIYSDPNLEATFRGIAKFDEDLSLYISLIFNFALFQFREKINPYYREKENICSISLLLFDY